MYCHYKKKKSTEFSVLGLYFCFTLFIQLGMYLSLIYAPNMQATILLGSFIILPLSIVYNPRRVNTFLLFWLFTHTILSIYFKPNNAMIDLLNCICTITLGIYLGNELMFVRLRSFDISRQLKIEKETDLLTGLYNRRKLLEVFESIENDRIQKLSGILMIDIDHFKAFNVKNGHVLGDKCLNYLGSLLNEFSVNKNVWFYRYGGEEFVALIYNHNYDNLVSFAERIRNTIEHGIFDGHTVTASIGVTYCGEETILDFESIINRADKAVYFAKDSGRNCVWIESSD